MKNIYICNNENEESVSTAARLKTLLKAKGFSLYDSFTPDIDFVISIGGDGAFLRTLQKMNYADVPVLGLKTGHLGFFCELSGLDNETVLDILENGNYTVQRHRTIECHVQCRNRESLLEPALNDILIKKDNSSMMHLKLYIGNSYIENFSGDGLLIASSAGSTAYNYSLGGSIVDPRLDLLQITPVAPANNAIYRSFTSSLLAPPDQVITIESEDIKNAVVIADGMEKHFSDVDRISICLSDKQIQIVRLPSYDFWGKVKSKFL